MGPKTLIFFFILLNEISRLVYGQIYPIQPPDIYKQYFEVAPLYNPALSDNSQKLNSAIGLESYFNAKNRTNIFFKLIANSAVFGVKNPRSNFGILNATQKIGSYLNKSRVYFLYCYHLNLDENLIIAAGANIGFYNDFVSDNPSGVSRSIFSPDGTVGLKLKYKNKLKISTAINQCFNDKYQNDKEIFHLKRHFVFTADYFMDYSAFWTNELGTLVRIIPSGSKDLHIYSRWVFKEVFGLGAIYSPRNLGGLISFSDNNNNVLNWVFGFSYYVPVGKEPLLDANKYNFTLKFTIE